MVLGKRWPNIFASNQVLLSAYLADPPTRRPNGEMTLALQAWVEQATKIIITSALRFSLALIITNA